MDGFLVKTFTRLRKEIPRRFKDLKTICDDLITKYTEEDPESPEPEVYLHPLIMACDTKYPRLMEIALDAFHFLLEHGQIGEKFHSANEDFKNKKPIDLVIETVCKCADEFDEAVHIQVIKALLTGITSLNCEVHGASLLLSIRACFHIDLMTKNPVIKVTAKGALTQMINVIIQRMEINEQRGTIRPQIETAESTDEVETGSDKISTEKLTPVAENSEPGNTLPPDLSSSEVDGNGDKSSEVFASIYHKDAYLLFRALCKLSMKGLSEDAQVAVNDSIMLQNKILSLELILNLLQNCGPAFRNGEKFILAVKNYLCHSLLTNSTSQVAQVTGLSLQIFVSLLQNFKPHLKSEVEVFVSTIFIRILESENSTHDHKMRVLEVFHNLCKDSSAQVEIFVNYDCDLEATNLFSRMVTAFAKIAKNPSASANNRIAVDFMASAGRKVQQEDLQLRQMGLEGLVIILKSLMVSANLQQASNAEESLKVDTDVNRSTKEENMEIEAFPAENSPMHSSGGESMANVVEAFDKKQKLQEEIETGILRFNLNPMKGIKYLVAMGHLEFNAKVVADFLHQHQDKLDKTAVGDLLGREKEYENGFCYQVLNEYVESMDFSDLVFDKAIRYFLSGFRLPGEAQKIDRIMEKFAERYYIQHKDQFASADMAFILAFSTIMLQTNLHNPAIRDDKRMTKEQFLKQNKGISADGELSDQLLMDIYDRIASEPISINEDKKLVKKEENPSFVVFHSVSDRKKKDAFNNERKEMVKVGEAMFRQKRKNSTYVQNRQINEEVYVRPMFEIVWPPVVGVISQLIENSDDSKIIEHSLNAIHYSIILACRLDCTTARNTFVHALSKFTALDTIKEMKMKNLSCIKLVLSVALSEGEYLDDNWIQILQCISLLARLQLFANGAHTDDMFFSETTSLASVSSESVRSNRRMTRFMSNEKQHNTGLGDPLTKLFVGPSKAEVNRQVEEGNAELISKFIDPVQIDRVFINSTSISASSVLYFVRSLCDVSILEITSGSAMNSLRGKESAFDASSPRIFSLQKLVEVADYNMNSRSRVDWGNIWNLLAKHFAYVGLSDNTALAMFAIDSLKQLSIKFLQKDELSNFNFQRLFLKPFESIISGSSNDDTKDLILRCLDILIRACSNNIRSGWRSIFCIFEVAAQQKNAEVSKIAFEIIERLMTNQFELLIYDFVELMNCLVVFVSCPHTQLSLKSLKYLEKCAEHLATGSVLPAANAQHPASDAIGLSWESSRAVEARNQVGEDSSIFRLWWPLLLGLSTRVADPRLQVRVEALETLQRILLNHGAIFSPQTWAVIFKGVLFPIIDSAKSDESIFIEQSNNYNKEGWINTMAASVLNIYSQLFLKYIENDAIVPILNDLLLVFGSCICQENLTLANISVRVLKELLFAIGQSKSSAAESKAEIKLLQKNHIDIVTRMLKSQLLKTLIFQYGDLGSLDLEPIPCPEPVLQAIKVAFPSLNSLSFLHKKKKGVVDHQTVITPYGSGKFVDIVPPVPELGLKSRAQVALEWGGNLFTTSNTLTAEFNHENDALNAPFEREEKVSIPQLISAVVTMTVVTSDMIKLIGQIFVHYINSFELSHCEDFLLALEACHWHAFAFNENNQLRLNLIRNGFLRLSHSGSSQQKRVAHLIEQEVLSLECIIHFIYSLYFQDKTTSLADKQSQDNVSLSKHSKKDSENFAKKWLERVTGLVFQRYFDCENLSAQTRQMLSLSVDPAHPAGQDGKGKNKASHVTHRRDHEIDDDEDEGFDAEDHAANNSDGLNLKKARHDAYLSPMVMVLSNIEKFSDEKFRENQSWLVPWLSRLLICENVKLRTYLSRIYQKHVNPKFS